MAGTFPAEDLDEEVGRNAAHSRVIRVAGFDRVMRLLAAGIIWGKPNAGGIRNARHQPSAI
jgi:hypothetical protein